MSGLSFRNIIIMWIFSTSDPTQHYKIIASLKAGFSLTSFFKNKYQETAIINEADWDFVLLELSS